MYLSETAVGFIVAPVNSKNKMLKVECFVSLCGRYSKIIYGRSILPLCRRETFEGHIVVKHDDPSDRGIVA